jgi:hypothetical protein
MVVTARREGEHHTIVCRGERKLSLIWKLQAFFQMRVLAVTARKSAGGDASHDQA